MTRRLLFAGAAAIAVAVLGTALGASAATLGIGTGGLTSFQVAGISGPRMTTMEMQDRDGNGKVDIVVVTFDSLVPATNDADWTLDAVPSGGTLAATGAIAVVGNQVFLTITEGIDGIDTAVGDFTVTLDDTTGGLVSFGPAAPDDGAGPVPTGVTSTNSGTAGLMEAGDTLTITFSEDIVGAGGPVAVSQQDDGTGSDFLDIPGITSGLVSLGSPDYLHARGKRATFAGSSWAAAGNTVTVTVAGTCSANPQSNCDKLTPGQGLFVYVPAATLTDAAGNPAAGSLSTLPSFRLF